MGTLSTPEQAAHWTSDDGLAVATIRHTGRSSDGRNTYQWSLYIAAIGRSWHSLVAFSTSADDIRSGVGADVNALDALESLASFLDAWACADRTAENGNLFDQNNAELVAWACNYSDELFADRCCLDIDS